MQTPPTAVRETAGNNTRGTASERHPGTTEEDGMSVSFIPEQLEKTLAGRGRRLSRA